MTVDCKSAFKSKWCKFVALDYWLLSYEDNDSGDISKITTVD